MSPSNRSRRSLRHAADPHGIDSGEVHPLGRALVAQLLQVLDDSDRSGLQVAAP